MIILRLIVPDVMNECVKNKMYIKYLFFYFYLSKLIKSGLLLLPEYPITQASVLYASAQNEYICHFGAGSCVTAASPLLLANALDKVMWLTSLCAKLAMWCWLVYFTNCARQWTAPSRKRMAPASRWAAHVSGTATATVWPRYSQYRHWHHSSSLLTDWSTFAPCRQLRVALGEPLPLLPSDRVWIGHLTSCCYCCPIKTFFLKNRNLSFFSFSVITAVFRLQVAMWHRCFASFGTHVTIHLFHLWLVIMLVSLIVVIVSWNKVK